MTKYPGIEFAKWAGLATMIYDHLQAFVAVPLPLAEHVGAFAFPLFVYAMVAALSDKPNGKMRQVLQRLFAVGVIAQLAVVVVREPLPLNVLFTLGSQEAWSNPPPNVVDHKRLFN